MKILQVSLSYRICTWNQTFCSVSAHGNDSNYFQLNLIHTRQNYIAFHYSSLYNRCLFVYWQQKTKTLLAARASGYVHTSQCKVSETNLLPGTMQGAQPPIQSSPQASLKTKLTKRISRIAARLWQMRMIPYKSKPQWQRAPAKQTKKTSDVFQAVIQRIKCLQKELFKISSLLGKKKMKHLQI